jgi:type II secretory pathway pseudopilin PulG
MRHARGFAYIALLAALTVLMLLLGMAAGDIAQAAQREREAQLLFVGKQFRNAIASYYERSPQGNHLYPDSLAQLLHDNRSAKAARHLRRIYFDPMTGGTEWGLLRNEQGKIIGVYSQSRQVPLKTSFEPELQLSFGDAPILSYADWQFAYRPADGSADLATPDAPVGDEDGGVEDDDSALEELNAAEASPADE